MLSEHHWQENEKKRKSWYSSSYKWFKMLEFTYFYFSVLSWKFENNSVHIYSREKWGEPLKVQKVNAVKIHQTHPLPALNSEAPKLDPFPAIPAFKCMQLKVLNNSCDQWNWAAKQAPQAHTPPAKTKLFGFLKTCSNVKTTYEISGKVLITKPWNQFTTDYNLKICRCEKQWRESFGGLKLFLSKN